MNLLFPLYLAGFLAISLPIVLHLIRRTPHGRTNFSSLMFLRPSPPRLSKHSRLENLLLLLLRALAIVLLALAFARPFLRQASFFNQISSRGRKVAILIDTSASMRQQGLWDRVVEKVDQLLDRASATDQFALYAFDHRLQTLVAFPTETATAVRDHRELIRQRVRATRPTWSTTDLGLALMTVADELHTHKDDGQPEGRETAVPQIVLISDVQEGSDLTALQRYRWPSEIQVAIEQVQPKSPGNASLNLISTQVDQLQTDKTPQDKRMRIRVANSGASKQEQLQLVWDTDNRTDEERPLGLHVPPGQSRVARVPPPNDQPGERLVLRGDDQSFDNVLYIADQNTVDVPIGYWGHDAVDDPQQMQYFLARAFAPGERLGFRLIDHGQSPAAVFATRPRLMVVTRMPSEQEAGLLTQYVERGGVVLQVIAARPAELEAWQSPLAALLDADSVQLSEAEGSEFALLGQIQFTHALFAPLADPRFNDFTKIHFWKHRRLTVDGADELAVVARFDDGDPALLHQRRGRGDVYLLTCGWHPEDSQLALSSKFVPLLTGMVRGIGDLTHRARNFDVNQPIPLPDNLDATPWTVRRPDGAEVSLAATDTTFDDTDQPGIYVLKQGQTEEPVAVNLAVAESRTDSLSFDQLEQHGVRLGWHLDEAAELERRRQQKDIELESEQRMWQWLIVAALGLLLVETWLAGRTSLRRHSAQGQPASG